MCPFFRRSTRLRIMFTSCGIYLPCSGILVEFNCYASAHCWRFTFVSSLIPSISVIQSALFGIPLCGLSALFPSNELAVFGREVEFIGVIILRLPCFFGLALPAPIAFSCARIISRWLVVNDMLL
ncbi:hypothetical protein AFLA70_145g001550 [Aspergillus flavus AF70]|nr:hypothetical protein AFLA70_145g001550 [Aspergillus flavus AF70]